MYDDREKAQRDYLWAIESARKEGFEEGWKIGLEEGREAVILGGKIQLLQQLLDEDANTTESLLQHSNEVLMSMLTDLQQRFPSRGE